MFVNLSSKKYPTNASPALPIAIKADTQTAVPASVVLFVKNVARFTAKAPSAIPGIRLYPHNKTTANAKPEHSQTGDAFEYSNATNRHAFAITKYIEAISRFRNKFRLREYNGDDISI